MNLIDLDFDLVITVSLNEAAPDSPGAAEWIAKHTAEYKKKYGSSWAHVLYGKAWHIYGRTATNGKRYKDD